MQSLSQLNHKIVEYSEISESLKSKNLFCSHAWVNSIQGYYGSKLYSVITSDKNNKIIAIFNFYILKKRFLYFYGAPIPGSFTPFQDPIFLNNIYSHLQNEIILLQIKKIYERFNCKFFEFKCSKKEVIDYLAKKIDGEIEYPSTFVIDIIDEEYNWKLMKDKTRNMIKKALKNDVIVSKVDGSLENIDTFYNLLLKTFKRSGKKPLHSKNFIKTLVTNLKNDNKLLFLLAERKGQVQSMGIFAHDEEIIHYISGASDVSSFKYGTNNLLQWEVIKYAINNKINEYDMGGRGLKSIDKFKESFGGKTVYYGKFAKKTKLMRVIENLYKFIKSNF